jgi:hypothetical protein
MAKENKKEDMQNLPDCVRDFIRQVIKKMRYRRKVRKEVQAELTAHFEDELKDRPTGRERDEKAKQLISEFGDVKMLAILLRRAKKRCRPLWRTMVAKGFQAIGVLILCLIFYCVYISLGQPNISVNYLREMTNMTRPVVDESQNAAPLYQKAFDLYKEPPDIELTKEELVYWDDKKLLNAIGNKQWIDELTTKELDSLKTWISSNAEAIKLFKQATDKPYCWWERKAAGESLINVLLPELSTIRDFSRLLSWRAILEANGGHVKEAFDDLLLCYRAGRHFQGPRTLIEQLVGWAIQAKSVGTAFTILQHQQVEALLLKDFQANLENLLAKGTYIPDYTTEKFFGLDFIQRCYTDNGYGSGHIIPSRLGIFSSSDSDILNETGNHFLDYSLFLGLSLVTADRENMRQAFENYYEKAQKWSHKTPWQLHQEHIDFELGIDKWSRLKQIRYWPLMYLMPALGRVNQLAYRDKLEAQALITITGLLRYRQDTGQYPENLSELVTAGYLRELPMDCFSDKPLLYKKTDDDFLLYSFGPNFTDDSGKPAYDDDGRIQMWSDKNGDTVFWPVPKPKIIITPAYEPPSYSERY